MKNFMNNFIAITKANTRTELKFVKALSEIPGIDVNTIKTENKYIRTEDHAYGVDHYVETKGISVTFTWLGHIIECHTDATMRMIISEINIIDGTPEEIGVVYWSANDGWHDASHMSKAPRWVEYVIRAIGTAVFKVSNKYGDRIVFDRKLCIDNYDIWNDGYSRVMITNKKTKKTEFLMGVDPWGNITWNDRQIKYVNLMRKLFVKNSK